MQKRVIKLPAKAHADKLDRLQIVRKAKIKKKAGSIRKSMQGLMLKGDKNTATKCSWGIG